MNSVIVSFEGVTKYYSDNKVLNDLTFAIKRGEFLVLTGASGCGKTTLLKLINKLLLPDSGTIFVDDRKISEWDNIELRRKIGYVIQQIGLFPHMSVEDNVSYVLDVMGKSKQEKRSRANELIRLVGLDETYLKRYPSELSGGQKQRVGVARALAADPELILMDEPFGAVDEIVRKVLQDEMLRLYKTLEKTIVFVTHDIEEAFKLGSRIVLMNSGRIEQDGSKEELLFAPASEYVEGFFGYKSYGAYLYSTKVRNVLTNMKQRYIEHDDIKKRAFCSEDASLMDAIKIMLDNEIDELEIRNEQSTVIGLLSLYDLSMQELANVHTNNA